MRVPNTGGVGSNRPISTRQQICGSDAVPMQICVPPQRSTPMTRLHFQSDIDLLLPTTSGRSRLRLLCYFNWHCARTVPSAL